MGIFAPNVKIMEEMKDIDGLLDALKHKDVEVARKAAGAIGRLGDPRAVDPLTRIFGSEFVEDCFKPESSDLYLLVLGDMAKALGEIGDKKAVKVLKRAAKVEFTSKLTGKRAGEVHFTSILHGYHLDLEEAAEYAAEERAQIDYFKKAVKDALSKIRAKNAGPRPSGRRGSSPRAPGPAGR